MANTTTSNVFLDFLKEIFNRLGQKNPKFFTVLAWISGALTALTGIPALLQEAGVTLGEFEPLANTVIAYINIAIFFVSNLTVQRTPVLVTDEKVVTEAKAETLPFTVKSEVKQAEKEAEKI